MPLVTSGPIHHHMPDTNERELEEGDRDEEVAEVGWVLERLIEKCTGGAGDYVHTCDGEVGVLIVHVLSP